MSEISVLVPSYNHAPFIERSLRSIFAQTIPIKKLIVIDDGSKDESVAVIETVLADCPFAYEFIKRENRGLCATLNEGFDKTGGAYFAYLGSDDVWLPTFLDEQTALLDSRPDAVLAFGHGYLIDEHDNIIDRTDNWFRFGDDVLPQLLRGEIFPSAGVLYRRSALKKYGWNENALLEDYELYLNLYPDGEFAQNGKLLCAWRQHGRNTSGDFQLMLQEHLAAQQRSAEKLGISPAELESVQHAIKFRAVSGYIRSGNIREAISLFWESRKGAESLYQAVKIFSRIAVPQRLFQWNRRRKRNNAIAANGKLRL